MLANTAVAQNTYPTTISEELEQIRQANNGLLDPVMVVEYSKDKNTLLHDKFEWNNIKAGNQWRLHQARQIIRLELTVVNSGKGKEVPTRTYVSLQTDRKSDPGRGYRTMIDVMSDADLTKQLLAEAKTDMDRFRTKYRTLTVLSNVFAAMAQVP